MASKRVILASVMIALAVPSAAQARAAVSTDAQEKFGFSIAGLARLDAFLEAKAVRRDMAGAVVLVARHGRIVHLKSIGFADIASGRRMTDDTIFRAYSMTKPVVAVALMMLYERGLFQLDDPVSRYLPEFTGIRVLRTPQSPLSDTVAPEREPTIHDLLRHTAGLSHGWGDDAVNTEYRRQNLFGLDVSVKQMTVKLGHIPLLYQPGTAFHYSVAPDVEARLVEVLSGQPFDMFLQQNLLSPLGMKDSGFDAVGERTSRLATVYWGKAGKLTPLDADHGYPAEAGFLGEPWTVNSYGQEHPRKGGSYGLVTTATDYWRFAQMLLDRGTFQGHRLLAPGTVASMTRRHLTAKQQAAFPEGLSWGLGMGVMDDTGLAGVAGADGTFYWSGAANTHFWVDPKNDIVVVALTQDMSNPADASFRDEMKALIYGALDD